MWTRFLVHSDASTGTKGRVLKSSARYVLDVGEPVIVHHIGGAVGEELNLVVERGGETIELSIIG